MNRRLPATFEGPEGTSNVFQSRANDKPFLAK